MQTNEFGQPIGDELGLWLPPESAPPLIALRGEYVTLEPLQRTHAIPLFHAFKQSNPEMWTYLPEGPFIDGAELGQLISTQERAAGVNPFAVIVNNEPLGFLTQMRIRPEEGVLEIGWVTFSTPLQQTREATEAFFLVLRHAFESGYRRVEWKCDALNARSRSAAERLGFLPEGIFRKATHYKGRNRDTAWFALTDDLWVDTEPRFRRWLDPSNFDERGIQKTTLGINGA